MIRSKKFYFVKINVQICVEFCSFITLLLLNIFLLETEQQKANICKHEGSYGFE